MPTAAHTDPLWSSQVKTFYGHPDRDTHVLSVTDTVVLYIQAPGITDYVIATQLIA